MLLQKYVGTVHEGGMITVLSKKHKTLARQFPKNVGISTTFYGY